MDIYTILQWTHISVALLILLAPGYRTTGLWVGLAAFGYAWTIEPDIIAKFAAGSKDDQAFVYITYLFMDFLFAVCHHALGGKGSIYQAKLLYIVAFFHGYAYLEFMGHLSAGLAYIFNYTYVPFLTKHVYTPAIITVNILQIVFLGRGIDDAIRTVKQSLRNHSLNDALRGWGRKMLAENPS